MATRKARTAKKGQNTKQSLTFYFDIKKYKMGPLKEDCYKESPIANRIPSPSNRLDTKNKLLTKRQRNLKSMPEISIKLKQKIVN